MTGIAAGAAVEAASVQAPVDRVAWIDVSRGLGIVLVVMGHVFLDPVLKKSIFLFHMPLFFFLSGLIVRNRTDIWSAFVKRGVSLLVPYVAFVLLVTAIDLIWSIKDGIQTLPLFPVIKFVARLIFGGSALKGSQGVAWFLPCLFMANLAYVALVGRFGGPLAKATAAIVIVVYLLSFLIPPMPTPLGVGQLPMALAFFWLGAVYRAFSAPPWSVFAALVIYGAGVIYAPMLDMKYMLFGWPFISLIVSLSGILLVFRISQEIVKIPVVSEVFIRLGRASLVIMFLHMLFVVHLRGHAPEVVILALGIVVPYCAYVLFTKFGWGRTLFLGQGEVPAVLVAWAKAR